jgi:hypothetical protein
MQSNGPLEDPTIADLCKAEWEKTAETFVLCRRKLIVEIATKLYLAGRVYVPARDLNDCDWAADFVAGR